MDPLTVDHIRALDLTGHHEHGSGFNISAGNTGQGVGAARPGGDHQQSQRVVYPGIGLGSDGGCLFMKTRHEPDFFAFAQRVVQMHGSAAGEHEHVAHAGFFQPRDHIVR